MQVIDPSSFEQDKFYQVLRGESVEENYVDLWPTLINRFFMEHILLEAGYSLDMSIDKMSDNELFIRYLIVEQLGAKRKEIQDLEMQRIRMMQG